MKTDELIEISSKNKKQVIPKKSDLNIADLLEKHLDSTQVLPDGSVYTIKKLVAKTKDLLIKVYPKDHEHQPHFHVTSKQRSLDARFDLNTLKLINIKSGTIKQNDVKKIKNFFEIHPECLEKLKNEHQRLNDF